MIPKDIEPIWDYLKRQVTFLRMRWKIFGQLYGASAKRVDLLNNSAPFFFGVIQNTMIDDISLSISRLLDKKNQSGFDNAVLRVLLDHPDVSLTTEDHGEAVGFLEKAAKSSQGIRQHRNKRIGHSDLAIAIKQSKPLPEILRKDIESCIDAFESYLNVFEHHFGIDSTAFKLTYAEDDGEALIACLQQAAAFRELLDSDKIDVRVLMDNEWSGV